MSLPGSCLGGEFRGRLDELLLHVTQLARWSFAEEDFIADEEGATATEASVSHIAFLLRNTLDLHDPCTSLIEVKASQGDPLSFDVTECALITRRGSR